MDTLVCTFLFVKSYFQVLWWFPGVFFHQIGLPAAFCIYFVHKHDNSKKSRWSWFCRCIQLWTIDKMTIFSWKYLPKSSGPVQSAPPVQQFTWPGWQQNHVDKRWRIPNPKPKTHWCHMGVSKNRVTPKWMVKIMEDPIKMDDLGIPLFLETPI